MAHIHLPDGSFTLQWVAVWWLFALVILGGALLLIRRKKRLDNRIITTAAFVTAVSFAIFQIDIPIFGGVHMNLTPLSAAIGHGGWGLIGANVVVNFSEVLVAYLTYRGLKPIVTGLFYRAGIATFAGLFVGNIVMIVVILISGIQGVTQTSSQILFGLSILAAVNMGIAVIEAVLTGFTVAYIGKIRPDLLGGDDP
jgi:cobalt/nickel transport system permease protein